MLLFCGIFAQIFHITRFSKIYYKKFLVLGFSKLDISKVPPSLNRILGILELDRGDSAPYIFDRKNRVYVPPFSFANLLKIRYLQKFSTFGIFTFITYTYTLNIYKKKVVILRRISERGCKWSKFVLLLFCVCKICTRFRVRVHY